MLPKGKKPVLNLRFLVFLGQFLQSHICWCVETQTLTLYTQGSGICAFWNAVILSTKWSNTFFHLTSGVQGCLVAFTVTSELY